MRVAAGCAASRSAAVLDSQLVRTADQRGSKDYDAGKTISARKRRVLIDTDGRPLAAPVHGWQALVVTSHT